MATANSNRRSKLGRKSSSAKGLFTQHRLSVQGTTYVKDLEFPADGPGRVIVRLERLMGSDRIRITDTKYMATLLQRLQEEEEITWQKRTRERRKAEHNRFRQLVIDGYTEPTPAMEDLYNHPVFRVNRILNRLNRLNHAATPTINLPPIVPIDPFKYDDTGRVFKSYPGHFPFRKPVKALSKSVNSMLEATSSSQLQLGQGQKLPYHMTAMPAIVEGESVTALENDEDGDEYEDEEYDEGENIEGEFFSRVKPSKPSGHLGVSTPSVERHSGQIIRPSAASVDKLSGQQPSSASTLEKHPTGHITFSTASPEVSMMSKRSPNSRIENKETSDETEGPQVLTLQEIQKKYGVASSTNLATQWKPYKSKVVDNMFLDKKRGVWDLYEMGAGVVDMYDRQQQTTEEYIASLNKNERSRVASDEEEDDGEEGELEDFDEYEEEELEVDDVPPLSDVYEFTSAEEEDEDTALEPLSYRTSDVEVSPTWDDLEEMWEEEETDITNEQEEDENEDNQQYE